MNVNKLNSNIAVLLFTLFFNGCSTVAVHSKSGVVPKPYAGTNIALKNTKRQWYKYDLYGLIVLTALDVPFSFMADTVLYPIDIYRLNNPETKK